MSSPIHAFTRPPGTATAAKPTRWRATGGTTTDLAADRVGPCPSIRRGRRAWARRFLLGALATWTLTAGAATEAPTLRIGLTPNAAPLAFMEDGVIRGLEPDLARALADALQMQLQLRQLPERALVTALRGGSIDLILTAMPDAELNALGLGASEPVLDFGQMVLMRLDTLSHYPRGIDILTTDGRVGYQRASPGARFAQERLPNARRVPFADAPDGISALRAGEIDLFIHDAPTVWDVATDPDEQQLVGFFQPLTKEQLVWAARADDQPLLHGINVAIRSWRKSGELQRRINRWIPIQVEVD